MRPLPAALVSVAAVLAACGEQFLPTPIRTPTPVPSDYVVIGQEANGKFIFGPLEEIRPEVEEHNPELAISFRDWVRVGGIEGSLLFFKATAGDGEVVYDARIDGVGDFILLPAGEYTFEPYYRSCSGSCQRPSGPQPFCKVEATLRPDRGYWLTVSVENERCRLRAIPGGGGL